MFHLPSRSYAVDLFVSRHLIELLIWNDAYRLKDVWNFPKETRLVLYCHNSVLLRNLFSLRLSFYKATNVFGRCHFRNLLFYWRNHINTSLRSCLWKESYLYWFNSYRINHILTIIVTFLTYIVNIYFLIRLEHKHVFKQPMFFWILARTLALNYQPRFLIGLVFHCMKVIT